MQLPRMNKAAPAAGSARTGGTMRADGPDLRAGGAAMTDVMITTPTGQMPAAALRKSLRATLRASAHPRPVLGITAAAALLAWRWRRG